jgi:DNA-binding NarL/FixJ family response regulator
VNKTQVILVDDHDLVLDGIASILNDAADIEVIHKATSVAGAIQYIQQRQPDLVITDISIGPSSGQELIDYIINHFPQIKIIALTMHNSLQYLATLLDAGVMGYLLKNTARTELYTAIKQVMAGQPYIQQSLAARYVQYRRQAEQDKTLLSPREMEIIRFIVQGCSTKEISRRLFISEQTVETHRKNIGRKTGAKTPLALMEFAKEQHLI